MRKKGKITYWNHQKGYGFIEPDSGDERVFVHITSLSNRELRPKIDQRVSYAQSKDKQGRARAINVTRAGDKPLRKHANYGKPLMMLLAVAFLAAVGTAVLVTDMPVQVLYVYLGLSALTFVVYAMDKNAAQRDSWRTPESTLHLLSLLGGWPGATIAQQTLRHKSQKKEFRFMFWVTVVLNCGGLYWLFTPGGAAWLNDFISSF